MYAKQVFFEKLQYRFSLEIYTWKKICKLEYIFFRNTYLNIFSLEIYTWIYLSTVNCASKKSAIVKLIGRGGSHTCNPSTLGDQGRGSPEVRSLRSAWPTGWNLVSTKNAKLSWAWWQESVIPATHEAEAGELLEHRRQRLQWAKMVIPLHFQPEHSSLGDRARFHLKKIVIA